MLFLATLGRGFAGHDLTQLPPMLLASALGGLAGGAAYWALAGRKAGAWRPHA